uniref:Uncharacterized protein n=1 Tax=Rhizophora mucronata TaxID=61149 RepID=A0A2P2P0B4_RHIMU
MVPANHHPQPPSFHFMGAWAIQDVKNIFLVDLTRGLIAI